MSKTQFAIRSGNDNIRITGLTFQYFASPSQQGAIFAENGQNWEVDHNTVRWNHAIGIFCSYAHGIRIHDNYVHHNGQLGVGHSRTNNSFIENNEVSFNNTDGYWGGDWESGGIKVTNSHYATTRNNNVHDNTGLGIWYDINNWMSVIYNNDINDNYADGIRYEISYQAEISYNRVRGNGYGFAANGRNGVNPDGSLFATSGINVNGSPDVEIHHNVLGPNQNGITAQERTRTNSDTDMSIGPWDTHNLWVHHNDITQTTGSTFGIGIAAGLNTLSPTDVNAYYLPAKNNRFDFNTYKLDTTAGVRFSWNHGYRNFTTWKASTTDPGSGPVFTGQEANGTCIVAPLPGWQVTAGPDDGVWSNNSSPTLFSSTGTTVRLGDFSATDLDRSGWVRFTGIGIPKNATITSATLLLYATGISGSIPSLLINGEAADNATAPTTRADVNARIRTTAQVPWVPASWTINSWRSSPDLTAIIQEIVNRTNWNAGNALQLFINDGQAGQVAGQISFQAYEGNPALSANLQVTWS
jgi:parallel beta-helix repeat protein